MRDIPGVKRHRAVVGEIGTVAALDHVPGVFRLWFLCEDFGEPFGLTRY